MDRTLININFVSILSDIISFSNNIDEQVSCVATMQSEVLELRNICSQDSISLLN